MILLDKDKNKYYYDKALVLIPEIEKQIGIDMSLVSFEKGDLPNYFYINVYELNKTYGNKTFQYNFETEFGGGQVVITNVGSSQEKMSFNNVINQIINSDDVYIKEENLYP